MNPKYFVDDTVRYSFEGNKYNRVVQGIKAGTGKANGDSEPPYFV